MLRSSVLPPTSSNSLPSQYPLFLLPGPSLLLLLADIDVREPRIAYPSSPLVHIVLILVYRLEIEAWSVTLLRITFIEDPRPFNRIRPFQPIRIIVDNLSSLLR